MLRPQPWMLSRRRREQCAWTQMKPGKPQDWIEDCALKPSAIVFLEPASDLLVTAFPGLSAPGQSSERPNTEKPPHGSQAVLPTVQKNQKPSTMILKYMEGISKRIVKIQALTSQNRRVDSFFSLSYCLPGCIGFLASRRGGSRTQDLKNKYESIPEESRTNTHTQLLWQDSAIHQVQHPNSIPSRGLSAEVHCEASDLD